MVAGIFGMNLTSHMEGSHVRPLAQVKKNSANIRKDLICKSDPNICHEHGAFKIGNRHKLLSYFFEAVNVALEPNRGLIHCRCPSPQMAFLIASWGSLAFAAIAFFSILIFAIKKRLLQIPDFSFSGNADVPS